MRRTRIKILIAIILLFAGGFIYIAFRTDTLVMFSWFKALKLNNLIYKVRDQVSGMYIPNFIKYCLPNALWITSYLFMVDALISVDNNKLFWALILPLIAVVFEILQLWNIIPGTFDFGDLLSYILPTIIYVIHYKHRV